MVLRYCFWIAILINCYTYTLLRVLVGTLIVEGCSLSKCTWGKDEQGQEMKLVVSSTPSHPKVSGY